LVMSSFFNFYAFSLVRKSVVLLLPLSLQVCPVIVVIFVCLGTVIKDYRCKPLL
jgi:hypothetical protein